jgi:thioredoxin reductase (NADPH)
VTEILDLRVRTYERVTGISGTRGDFTVSTERRGESASYQCSYIILATGGLDTPRYLGIPGEDAAHVSHYFDDPHRYFRQKLLIVGGRNSAVEAAVRSWRAGARVGLSYRRAEIEEAHVLSRLHLEVSLLIKKGQIDFYPSTEPVKIGTRSVTLRHTAGSPEPGSSMQVAADFVYLATGFRQNPALFREAGVTLEGSEMRPRFDPRSMETDVPGIYLAGTAAGGSQREFSEFITTGHVHSRRILQHLTGGSGAVTGNLPERDYPLSPDDIH